MYAIRIGDVFVSGEGRIIVTGKITRKEKGDYERRIYQLTFADGSNVWVDSSALEGFQRLQINVNVFTDNLPSKLLEDPTEGKSEGK